MDKPKTYKTCQFSPDCFSCPLSDCRISDNDAMTSNVLPHEHELMPNAKMKGERHDI